MKTEILKKISKHLNDPRNYYIDFDGENIATDVVSMEKETSKCCFLLTVQVWLKQTTWEGLTLEDFEVLEFEVWDMNGETLDSDISDAEIREQITIYK